MRKQLIAASCAAVLALGLGACSSGAAESKDKADSGSTDAKDSSKETTIEWNMWGASEDDLKFLNETIALVEKQLPGTKIDLKEASWGDYWTKLTTNLSSGQTGCVLGINSTKLDTYGVAFDELTDEDLKTAGIDPDAYGPGVLDMFRTAEGKRVGIPYDVATMLVYLNEDAFNSAGVELPKPDWTFDDFDKAAQTITDKGEMKGFAVSPAEFQFLALPIDKAGVQPISKDGKLQLTDPKLLDAFTWYGDLAAKKKVADPVDTASSTGWGENQYSNGNAAMAVDGTWNATGYIKGSSDPDAPRFKAGFAPLPKGEAGRTQMLLGSGYGISKTCENREAALKVLGALVSKEAQDLIASLGRSYPALTASQAGYFDSVPEGAGPALKEVFDAAFANAEAPYHAKNWTKVSDALANELVQVYNDQGTMKDAMENLQQQFGN